MPFAGSQPRAAMVRVPAPYPHFANIGSTTLLQEQTMPTFSSDLLRDLSPEQCAAVAGGRMKLPFQNVSPNQLLTSADGEPVSVYVDGVLINSVSTGFVHL
jgi:hypothetical protein